MSIIEPITPELRTERERIKMKCRADRHDMERLPAYAGWKPPESDYWKMAKYVLHKRCRHCGTWRHIAIDYRYCRLASYYEQPEWYKREPGEGRMPSEDVLRWEIEDMESHTPPARLRAAK